MNDNNRRVETSFRIAAIAKMWMINRANKLGCTVAKLLESIVLDYIQRHGEEEPANTPISATGVIDGKVEDVSCELLYRMYQIYFMRTQAKFEFPKETGITVDGLTFKYLNTANLQGIFENYFASKNLALPDLKVLIENAKLGYKETEAFGRVKLIKLSEVEIIGLEKP